MSFDKTPWVKLDEDQKKERLRLAVAPQMVETKINREAKELIINNLGRVIGQVPIETELAYVYEYKPLDLVVEKMFHREVLRVKDWVMPAGHRNMSEACQEWAGLKYRDPFVNVQRMKLWGFQLLETWAGLADHIDIERAQVIEIVRNMPEN